MALCELQFMVFPGSLPLMFCMRPLFNNRNPQVSVFGTLFILFFNLELPPTRKHSAWPSRHRQQVIGQMLLVLF